MGSTTKVKAKVKPPSPAMTSDIMNRWDEKRKKGIVATIAQARLCVYASPPQIFSLFGQ